MFEALHSLAIEVTAYAEMSGLQFPFVTMPLFEANAYHARQLSSAEVFAYHPVVKGELRSEWQDYSVRNQDWVQKSILIFTGEEGYEFEAGRFQNTTITPVVWHHDDDDGAKIATPGESNVCYS